MKWLSTFVTYECIYSIRYILMLCNVNTYIVIESSKWLFNWSYTKEKKNITIVPNIPFCFCSSIVNYYGLFSFDLPYWITFYWNMTWSDIFWICNFPIQRFLHYNQWLASLIETNILFGRNKDLIWFNDMIIIIIIIAFSISTFIIDIWS